MTSVFISDLQGAEGGRVREGPGMVIVESTTCSKYILINIFIDYIFEYNQQINSAIARNRTEILVVFK